MKLFFFRVQLEICISPLTPNIHSAAHCTQRDRPPWFEISPRLPLAPGGDILTAWLNDTLLSVVAKFIRAAMPDPSDHVQTDTVPTVICILDGFLATNLPTVMRLTITTTSCDDYTPNAVFQHYDVC